MRIISGQNKGTKLIVPKGMMTRPTSDRSKESLFNILAHNKIIKAHDISIKGAVIADLCAGSGSLGFEALSRGADEGLFIDSNMDAIKALRMNGEKLGCMDKISIIKKDIRHFTPTTPADIIFIDPPYHHDPAMTMAIIHKQGWANQQNSCLIYQSAPDQTLLNSYHSYRLILDIPLRDAIFWIYVG